ncbi:MAG: hypothetical protein BIFFINMI_04291 [Phycisphaerae bacterium]|nr:hypothetical protein [Phycisphaerae bacterium]
MESETGATGAAEQAAGGHVRPGALTVEQMARLLTAAGGRTIGEATVRRHIDAGAPTLADGRLNLVHYLAWLVREVAVGEE